MSEDLYYLSDSAQKAIRAEFETYLAKGAE